MSKVQFWLISLASLLLLSCAKEEGKGGQATLVGKVYIQDIDETTGDVINVYPAIDQRVFVKYGDNDIHDDDFRTNTNGEYKFEGLRTGDYTIQSYYICGDCSEPESFAEQDVNISDSKGTTTVPDIFLQNSIIEDGAVSITGTAYFQDTIPSQQRVVTAIAIDQRVYLVHNNETIYRDDFRTDYEGRFRFDGLKPGNYTIYSYICNDCGSSPIKSEISFTITEKQGTVETPNLYIKSYQI